MKLSRLFATLALIVGAAVAAPAPASAVIERGEPLSPATVESICTMLGGAYTYNERDSVCLLGDEIQIVCADTCAYRLDGRIATPMLAACGYARGTFLEGAHYLYTCETKQAVFTVECPDQLTPYMVCEFAAEALSDQPMSS